MEQQVVRPYSADDAVSTILDSVIETVRRRSGAPFFIGISGIDCSGKTTLARNLLASVDGAEVSARILSGDDFIVPRKRRAHDPLPHVDYFENTFDHPALGHTVRRLKQESSFDIVIVEGVFLLRRELANLWDMSVWLELPPHEAIRRGAERDAAYFGSVEHARFQYERRFIPAHEHHVQRDDPASRADLVFTME